MNEGAAWRVFVTGATGFVGKHLVAQLAGKANLVLTVRPGTGALPLATGIERVEFDLTRPESLQPNAFARVDCVMHLAGLAHLPERQQRDEARFFSLNTHATEILARSAAQQGVRRFVFLSSIKVNGEHSERGAFRSDDVPNPCDAYGRSKLAAEQALARIGEQEGLEVAIVRSPLVYGPGVGGNFARMMQVVRESKILPLASINNRRSLVNVFNLVSFLEVVARHSGAPGKIWLVSDGEDVSVPELLRLIADYMNRRDNLWPMPVPLLRLLGLLTGKSAMVARLANSLQVNDAASRELLGWQPPVPMREALERTTQAFMRESPGRVGAAT